MEAKELRIGNLVNHKNDVSINTVFSLDKEDNRFRINYIGQEFYKPIPLTEEWLLKFGFGFKKTDKTHSYTLNNFRINFVKKGQNEGRIFIVFANDINFEGTFFEIHQLQNLYFALTGEELCL